MVGDFLAFERLLEVEFGVNQEIFDFIDMV